MKDPELIRDANTRKLEISLVTGSEVEALLNRANAASPDTLARVKAALQR
jgi:hypothetical protein